MAKWIVLILPARLNNVCGWHEHWMIVWSNKWLSFSQASVSKSWLYGMVFDWHRTYRTWSQVAWAGRVNHVTRYKYIDSRIRYSFYKWMNQPFIYNWIQLETANNSLLQSMNQVWIWSKNKCDWSLSSQLTRLKPTRRNVWQWIMSPNQVLLVLIQALLVHVSQSKKQLVDINNDWIVVSHLTTQRNAIAMLHSRIQFLHQYLQDTKDGKIPMDHDIIRQIVSVCRRAPLTTSPEFDAQFSTVRKRWLFLLCYSGLTRWSF